MAYISLGYECNHNCIICPNKGADRRISTPKKQILEMLDNLKKSGQGGVTISGGEPTLCDTFLETIHYATKLGLKTNVLSNGDALSDMGLVRKIEGAVDKSLFSITTAFHSHIPRVHNGICGRSGAFDRSMQGVYNAYSADLKVQIKHCIHKRNYADTRNFIDFVNNNFPDFSSLILCGIDFVGLGKDEIDDIGISFDELGQSIECAIDRVIDYRENGNQREVFVTETPLCIVDPYYWSFFEPKLNFLIKYLAPEEQETDIESDCGAYYKACRDCGVNDVCQGAWKSTVAALGEADLTAVNVIERG